METHLLLILSAACPVGKSSASLRKGAFVGTPAVNIGTRQDGREHGPNIVDVGHDQGALVDAIRQQVRHRSYAPAYFYGDGRAGERIADLLPRTALHVQKRIQ